MRQPRRRATGTLLAWLLVAGWVLASDSPNLLSNGEFEDVKGSVPAAWRIDDGGLTTLTDMRAHSGKCALKIADPSEKAGSSAVSERKPVEPGTKYGIRLWCYLEEGKPGLGVYLRLWDAAGKELVGPRERSMRVARMQRGQWAETFFVVTVPTEAREMAVWLHTFSSAILTGYVDDVELITIEPGALEEQEHWAGGQPDERVVKVGKLSYQWAHATSSSISMNFAQPQDWSKFGAVSFWLHSPAASRSAFMLIIPSENVETEGMDYYSCPIVLDWTGWKKFVLPFRELGASRQPVGWQKIDRVYFTASGWGNTPNPRVVVNLDDFRTVPWDDAGSLMTDEELFAALDLERPALKDVKAAVREGDLVKAKRELTAYLRSREKPRWYFDWRDHPFQDVEVPTEDNAPDQWDYYSRYLTIDWEGWKHFRLTKEELTPRAFVEGQGWKGKRPIGWHWIRYLAFNAKGWGLTPPAGVSLYFDEIRLVGADRIVTVSDFEEEPIRWEGLEQSAEQAKAGQFAGKWADLVTRGGLRCWQIPHDWSEFEALEFWVYSTKATDSRIILVLDSDVPQSSKKADELLALKFDFGYPGAGRFDIQFEDRIDWSANPTKGDARTHLWNESLNRHFHFRTLADAYWQTGIEKYAEGLVAHWLDWIKQNPRPRLSSGNRVSWPYGCYAWQTLTTGIRLESTWPHALYRCLRSPAFTSEAVAMIFKSVADQARHLVKWKTSNNWLTEESMGLFTAGMLFPEFKGAKDWRRLAVERLYGQLDDEVYPDGMEYELAAGYNNWVVRNFTKLLERAALNELQDEIPADLQEKMEKMFHYLLYASTPAGKLPGLNDSGNADVRQLLAKGHELFPHREDFLYVATKGQQGQAPEHLSYAFPYSGHYVMRTGWDPDACFLLFDSGPYGSGHQHEDKLHFVLHAYGRQLVIDPGNYSYDASKWRRYVLTTPGHNTILVDGQGQNRRRKRETYVWPKPWDQPSPPQNDTRWVSDKDLDYVVGTYGDDYGPKNDATVTHTRRVLFVKPEYFVVVDTMTATDEKVHRYESLFHLDATMATVDDENRFVLTDNSEASDLLIAPLSDQGLRLRVVKGRKDPVQGWANHPWRAVPTAVYTKQGKGTVRLLYVLCPIRPGQTKPVTSVEPLPLKQTEGDLVEGVAAKIAFADGRVHYFVQLDEPGREVSFGEFTTDNEVTLIRVGADGQTERIQIQSSSSPPASDGSQPR